MGKINVLEPNVFNMISAGEVVERPSSVVKELVENSIDAGATDVSIYVENGGIRKIQVSDNGIGIEKDDVRKAFLPHATSKLKNIVDLDSLATLGFRGEALASISSVSEVTLSSKSKNQDVASKIALSGGKVTFEGEDSRAQGTVITVENLFFNTPARLKFLKKGASELNYIKDTVRMLILANPTIRITLSDEEGIVISNDGSELIDAIYSVYGAKTADNLVEIVDNSYGNIRVSGYTSKVDFTKSNRTYQTIIVNGRAVEDQTIQTAVEKAYAEYLMKRNYPMFVLDVLMPFDDVDVNVHPSKTEVRFRDKHAVFSAVYHAIQNTINASLQNVSFGFDMSQSASQNVQNVTEQSDFGKKIEQNDGKTTKPKFTQASIDTSKLFSGKTTPKNYFRFEFQGEKSSNSELKESRFSTPFDFDFTHSSKSDVQRIEENREENGNTEQSSDSQDYSVFDGKIVGQIFDTYIICERADLVYLIDQHAAHERMIYEKLTQMNDEKETMYQMLLSPVAITLSASEYDAVEDKMKSLEKYGFVVEDFGSNTILVRQVPVSLRDEDMKNVILDIINNSSTDYMEENIHTIACKAAIKANKKLSDKEIDELVRLFVAQGGVNTCPHGRPIMVKVTRYELEKMFKRIQ